MNYEQQIMTRNPSLINKETGRIDNLRIDETIWFTDGNGNVLGHAVNYSHGFMNGRFGTERF
jgi:hypothetical protein